MKQIGGNSKVGCVLNVDMKPEVPWDRSVYGHELTNHGSIWNLDGRYFDGVNDYIDCGNAPSLDITNEITLKTRIKTEDFADSYNAFISRGVKYVFYVSYAGKLGNYINQSGWYYSDSIKTLDLNKYYYVTMMYNPSGGNIRLSINNNEVSYAHMNTITGSFDSGDNTYIGRYTTNYFKGFIPSMRVYNYTLPFPLQPYEV